MTAPLFARRRLRAFLLVSLALLALAPSPPPSEASAVPAASEARETDVVIYVGSG